MSQDDRARYWHRTIRATRLKVNLGWWLECLGPLCIAYSVLAASSLLYLRTQPWFEGKLDTALISAGGVLALLPLVAWLIARARFIDPKEAAVRVESEMQLRNALTAAENGIASWPEPPAKPLRARDGLNWNWTRLAIPPAIAVLLVGAAFLIPVQPLEATSTPTNEPIAWNEMEDWLKTLEEEDVVEEEKIEDVREQLGALRDQPEKEWFEHSSLEATDTLRQSLQRSISDLEKNLSTAERSLGALEKHSEAMSQAARDQLLNEFNEALGGMQLGSLPLNEDLMKSLQNIDPQQLSQMSQEQLQQLRENLQKNAGACQKCMGGSPGMGELSEDESELMKLLSGQGNKPGMKPGEMPGKGGITRGPGEAPMFFSDDEKNLNSDDFEAISNPDISRAAPGDTLGTGQAEHDIDEKSTGPREAGAVRSTGKGGEAVWQENLLPSEKEVLQRYFE